MITIISNRYFGMFSIGLRGGHWRGISVGKMEKGSRIVVPSIHGTLFCGLTLLVR
jgi:hypothetical protein